MRLGQGKHWPQKELLLQVKILQIVHSFPGWLSYSVMTMINECHRVNIAQRVEAREKRLVKRGTWLLREQSFSYLHSSSGVVTYL